MSPLKKISRHTIASGEMPAFSFLGLVSAEPDYRLSVLLNKHLGTDLRKCREDITSITETGKHSFSCFRSDPPPFSLVSNHGEGNILIRKLKKIDFLFVSGGPPDREKAESLAVIVRTIPGITAVFVFESSEISDRNISLIAL